MKFRLVAFVLAMAAIVGMIAWTAHSSWQRTGELSEKLTGVQLESFRIADHIQSTILELNSVVLRFGVYHDPKDWAAFTIASTNLDLWIDEQRPILATEQEKHILDKINGTYDDYLLAARQIGARAGGEPMVNPRLSDFADFEHQSRLILDLGLHLAQAHRASLDNFLAGSKKSLNYLRFLLLTSLALLLLAGAGLAVAVYRELIAPLRVKLVESQALVERQEKLASLGMLAAGVAHEIRNPLTAIKAWLFIQQKHLRPGTSEHADAEIIGEEIIRLERIVKDVLGFARPSEPQFASAPVERTLAEVQTLLAPTLAQNRIRLDFENGVTASAHMDPQQIKQVLINLIQNAAESIGQDGVVTLGVRRGTMRLRERLTEVVILEVADTGKGIPAAVEKRLFDPFFTTKDTGTGLGLAIAARIVEKHGGALQYQTHVNHGTTFGIVLPRVTDRK